MQKVVHWLEEGSGKRVILITGVLVGILFFSIFLSYKRYRGPSEELVFEQALMGRSLAEGKGFSTPVLYPQAVAYLNENGGAYGGDANIPELYHAPLYSMVLAAGLWVLPQSTSAWLWATPEFAGFHADLYLLAVNLIFFWLCCGLVWWLSNCLFKQQVAWISLAAYVFSISVWEGVLGVNGYMIMSLLVLLLVLLIYYTEKSRASGLPFALAKSLWKIAAMAVVVALMFLTEYTAILVLFPVLAYLTWALRGGLRWAGLAVYLLVFCVVISPWLVRNIAVSSSPVGLAWQNIALREGDPTAEPSAMRRSFSADTATISIRKTINKGLDGIKNNFRTHLWSSGALLFTAFFVAGLFYRFQNEVTNVVRWFVALLVLTLLLGQPFIDSGMLAFSAVVYLAPLVMILGVGFFLILLESTKRRTEFERYGLIAIVLLVNTLPLTHWLLEPSRGIYYSYPPYSPRLMHLAKTGLKDKFYPKFGLMADVPGGVAWYSQQTVWAQPIQYRDFDKVLDLQAIGALYLSPDVLDRPFFGKLLQEGGEAGLG